MKKIITSLSSALLILVASLSLTGVAKSAEFFHDRNWWTYWGLFPNG